MDISYNCGTFKEYDWLLLNVQAIRDFEITTEYINQGEGLTCSKGMKLKVLHLLYQ